jgi:cysteine desulfurase
LDKEQAYLKDLEAYFIGKLNEAGFDYRLNGNKNHIPGLLSVSFKGAEGEMILHRLDLQHIEVATGSACNSHETEVSDVLRAAGIPREYIEGTIRFSFGMENTKEEIDTIVNALKKILLK